MPRESGIRQRAIVGRRLDLADFELLTKYTLPFVDAAWEVPFAVLDLVGSPPRVLAGPIHWDGSRLHSTESKAALRRIESVPPEDLGHLVHYDPWWVFRGASGVDRTWIEAAFATNIARPFMHAGKKLKIHDLRFDDGMERLEAILAKDDVFRPIELHRGEVDLLSLRRGRPDDVEGSSSPTAKAL